MSFFLYSDISPMTKNLAFYEWLIFLVAAMLVWKESQLRTGVSARFRKAKE